MNTELLKVRRWTAHNETWRHLPYPVHHPSQTETERLEVNGAWHWPRVKKRADNQMKRSTHELKMNMLTG